MIRPLTLADHAAAARVYNNYIATSTATFHVDPMTPQQWAAEFAGRGDPVRHGAWAIDAAGEPAVPDDRQVPGGGGAPEGGGGGGGVFAGYLLLVPWSTRPGYADTAEVTIYLAPEHTGRGLGRAALQHAHRHAEQAGLHVLLAGACTENTASIRLFTAAGYVEVARLREVGRKFGRLLDVVYLEKVVGSPP